MERISKLLDNVQKSHSVRFGYKRMSPEYRWMVEATNRIQELQHEVENLKTALRTKADQF